MIINCIDYYKKKISYVGLIVSFGLKIVKKIKFCGWG